MEAFVLYARNVGKTLFIGSFLTNGLNQIKNRQFIEKTIGMKKQYSKNCKLLFICILDFELINLRNSLFLYQLNFVILY